MQRLVIWPHVNPKLEVAVVLLIVPFVVNVSTSVKVSIHICLSIFDLFVQVIVFWVIDNLLMRQRKKTDAEAAEAVTVADLRRACALDAAAPVHNDYSEEFDYEPLVRSGGTSANASASTLHPLA